MTIALWIHSKDEVESLIEWGDFFSSQLDTPLQVFHSGPRQVSEEIKSLSWEERAEDSFLSKVPSQVACNQLNGSSQFKLLLQFCKDNSCKLLICGIRGREEISSLIGEDVKGDWTEALICPSITLRGNLPDYSSTFRLALSVQEQAQSLELLQFVRHWMEKNKDLNVEIFHVVSNECEEAMGLGQKLIDILIEKAKFTPDTVQPGHKILVSEDIAQEISSLCKIDYDLVLVASASANWIHRVLFNSLREEEFYDRSNAAIGIFSKSGERIRNLNKSLVERFRDLLPGLERQDRLSLFEELEQKSSTSIDFYTLITLSSLIASLGLLQNSPAIIIGAMLVAPLMTPMLGAGLGLVQGNVLLVKNAVVTIGNGFLMAMLLGILVGIIVPGSHLPPEVISRTSPNVLDLMVALISGIAAAYSTARPGLMGALPGVAIAAALVPPLASAGICLARSETALGVGAASLFGINLIAIILASAATLYCLGVKPPDLKKPLRLWARRAVEVLLIVALVISFPLTIRLFQQINPASTSQIHELHAIWPQTSTLKTIEIPRDTPDQIILNIDTSQPLTSEQIKELHTLLVKYYKRTLKLEVRQTIVAHIENSW